MVSDGAMQSSGHGGRPISGTQLRGGKKPPGPPTPTAPFNRAVDRVEAIPRSKAIETKDVHFRYAYLSQRGFYPDDPFKPNQDSYCVHETVTKQQHDGVLKMDSLFGVFDGHGKSGHDCARYARNNMPHKLKLALDEARQKSPDQHDLHRHQIEEALKRAHLETNVGLTSNTQIDDDLSGTTAISIYMHGRRNRITVSNVGDSRAIVGTLAPLSGQKRDPRVPPVLKAFPLSRDQTPYRKDEAQRCRQAGARILSLDQLEGVVPMPPDDDHGENSKEMVLGEDLDEDGDPPRIWHPTEEYPGCAFTRSIGDHKAEALGVIAEPEMLTRELHPDDKMLILASDGVFEFLTNQSVIDICAKFRDPLEACRAVVAEAYELWLQYELRTDDITIIVIFLDEVRNTLLGSSSALDVDPQTLVPDEKDLESDTEEIKHLILPETGFRPVRKHASKDKQSAMNKLKAMGNDASHQEDDNFDLSKFQTQKTKEEEYSIADAVKASQMFRNINEEQRQLIFSCMESIHVEKGTWVIKQGDPGDKFYIIDEGFFEVRILPDGMKDETGEGGNIIYVYEGSRAKHMHPSFGELALMYSAPRTASIVAQSDGHLWALHRSVFRQVLVKAQDKHKELKKVLTKIPCFQHLNEKGLTKLAGCMSESSFTCGDNIIEQGYPGKKLFVVKTGSGYTVEMVPGETIRGTVRQGHYFGDEVFAEPDEAPRYCKTVTVLQNTKCWVLDRDEAKKNLGPLYSKK